MTKEALKLALEALEEIALAGMSGTGQESKEAMTEWHARQAWKFIGIAARQLTAIKEALAQPEQEPVAYFNPQVKGGFYWARPTKITAPVTVSVEPMPLYTTPPQRTWVGLTNEDMYEFAAAQYCWEDLLFAAETKLKEKNT